MYKLETELVEDFTSSLNDYQNPFDVADYASEFYYLSGRVDLVGRTGTGKLVAFEAKLHKWRNALNQAYRNTSFAHYSYVVLPLEKIKNALINQYEFERRGVGLCSVDSSGIKVEIPALPRKPLQPWLTDNALNFITREDCE